jgi:DNA-binding response OmpR family regulator
VITLGRHGKILRKFHEFESRMERMNPAQSRVAVVDDERNVRELLEIALGQEGFEVRSAGDGQQALTLVRDWRPDVIVLDVMLPKIDGIALVPLFRRITEAPIVMLSAKGGVTDRVAGLSHGADDYLAKPFEVAELVARLHSALRRPRLAQANVLSYADLRVDLDTRIVIRANQRIDLTAREYDLLVTLLRNARHVFSRDQLLDLVWGPDRDVEPGTVETYISYLRSKIDQSFEPRLIQTIRGAGYSLREG